MSYIIEGNTSRLSAFMNTGIAPRVIEFLTSGEPDIMVPALRTLGNVCYGNESHIQVLINNGLLHHLEVLLGHKKKLIRREVCWNISNIAASTAKHVEAIFGQQSLIEKLYLKLKDESESK